MFSLGFSHFFGFLILGKFHDKESVDCFFLKFFLLFFSVLVFLVIMSNKASLESYYFHTDLFTRLKKACSIQN